MSNTDEDNLDKAFSLAGAALTFVENIAKLLEEEQRERKRKVTQSEPDPFKKKKVAESNNRTYSLVQQINGKEYAFRNRWMIPDDLINESERHALEVSEGFNIEQLPEEAWGVVWRLNSFLLDPWDEDDVEKVLNCMENGTTEDQVHAVRDKWFPYIQRSKSGLTPKGPFSHCYLFFTFK